MTDWNLADLEAVDVAIAEESLYDYVKLMWSAVEPGRELTEGWVLQAICSHLEAVERGDITRLIMNVPPGSMKSLLTSVFWPSWVWGPRRRPSARFLCLSYSSALTIRDNVRFKQLISSSLYQKYWGKSFSISDSDASKVKFANSATGWKLASSIGGTVTGERADFVVCLPWDCDILTDIGLVPIGRIVDERLPVLVAGYTGAGVVWQRIEAYEENPSRPCVEIDFGSDVLRCTEDHLVWVEGRGYVAAGDVQRGDVLWAAGPEALSILWDCHSWQAEPERATTVLQLKVPGLVEDRQGDASVRLVQGAVLSVAGASCAHAERDVLQPQMLRGSESRQEQPAVRWRTSSGNVQSLRQDQDAQSGGSGAGRTLFDEVRGGDGPEADGRASHRPMRDMRCDVLTPESEPRTMLSRVCRGGPLQADEGCGEWSLRSRRAREAVSAGLDQILQGEDPGAGRRMLPDVRTNANAGEPASLRSSHRLREGKLGPVEPDNGLQILPRQDARQAGQPPGLERAVVRDVKRSAIVEPRTYNVRVGPCHNYFAAGVLVHNCDDPNSVDEAESEAVRASTKAFLLESMPTRLNDPAKSAIVLVQQRTHQEDATGILIEDGDDWTWLVLPMRYDSSRHCETSIGFSDPRTEDGALLWPERFPAWVVERDERKLGPYAVAGQFQQMPVPRGGAILRREWLLDWGDPDNAAGGRFPPCELTIAFVDGAYTIKEEQDPSAMVVLGVFSDPRTGDCRVIIMNAWEEWLELHGLVEKVAKTCKKYGVDRLLIENKASGHSVAQEINRLYARESWSTHLIDPEGRDKISRAHSVVPVMAAGLVYCPGLGVPGLAWADKLANQISSFPRASHDDLTDALVGGLMWLRKNGILLRDPEARARERDEVDRGGPVGALYAT